MGCSLLSGLVEKMGFGNFPLRKTGLHQYLMGEIALDSGYMQSRLRDIIMAHAQPAHIGGVSVLDRDNSPARTLTDPARVAGRLDSLSPATLTDLYFACRNIYADSVIYKQVTSNPGWHAEQTVDIHRFDPAALYARYTDNFENVKMIHMHRPFPQWINSLAAQGFVHPQLKNRVKFFPHMRYADYRLYERCLEKMPGLHLHFDDLFDTPIDALAQKIAAYLDVPAPSIDLKAQDYDLYGKLVPYQNAFTRFDDNIEYLRRDTLTYFVTISNDNAMRRPATQINAWLRYLGDMVRFRRQRGMRLL
jgi:hypothetical protein